MKMIPLFFRQIRRKCRFRIGAPHVNLYNRYPSIRQAKKAFADLKQLEPRLCLVEGQRSPEGWINANRRRRMRKPVKLFLEETILSTPQIRTVFFHEQPHRIHREPKGQSSRKGRA